MYRIFPILTALILFSACYSDPNTEPRSPREPFVAITATPPEESTSVGLRSSATETPSAVTFEDKHWQIFSESWGDFFVGKVHMHPLPGSELQPMSQPHASVFSECRYNSRVLPSTLPAATNITKQVIGYGMGPCAGWFVLEQTTVQQNQPLNETYAWIPETSLMRISPAAKASDAINLRPVKTVNSPTLRPLAICDPTGWWQTSSYFGAVGFQWWMTKMEFHDDLAKLHEGDWLDNWDQEEYSPQQFWRGGLLLSTKGRGVAVYGIGWGDGKPEPETAFVWRYISPDKTPTEEPNYGIEIKGKGWTQYAEFSIDCMGQRGETRTKTGKAIFRSGRILYSEYRNDIDLSPESKGPWHVIETDLELFAPICDPVGTWEAHYRIGNIDYFYALVFEPNGVGYEWVLTQEYESIFGLNWGRFGDEELPLDGATPFWWAMRGNTVFYKEFSNVLTINNSDGSVPTASLRFFGCDYMFVNDQPVKVSYVQKNGRRTSSELYRYGWIKQYKDEN
jgi:hypothetical protein